MFRSDTQWELQKYLLTQFSGGEQHFLIGESVFVSAFQVIAYSVGFLISEEDLALGPGTRLDHSRAFV